MAGEGAGRGNGSKEKQKWSDSKLYSRKSSKPAFKHNAVASSQKKKKQLQRQQAVPTYTDDANSSLQQPPPAHNQQPTSVVSNDNSSSLNNNHNANADNSKKKRPFGPGKGIGLKGGKRPLISRKVDSNGNQLVTIDLSSKSHFKVTELRNQLKEELYEVRAVVKRLEACELLLRQYGSAPAAAGYSQSQLSANDARPIPAHKKAVGNVDATSPAPAHHQLSVSVASGQMEVNSVSETFEKRTPKANQFYRNSDFLLGMDKFLPPNLHKKTKGNGSKKHTIGDFDSCSPVASKYYIQAFKSCSVLLLKLMRHRHGWVFNTPVDVKGLGLHDYNSIIKHPMDLGTVKSCLDKNWYKSPREFAEDVRLTFTNAITYNPKEQDVHVMADQLLQIFEERWPAIEAEFTVPSYSKTTKTRNVSPTPDKRRILERSESSTHPVVPDSTPKTLKTLSHVPHVGRTPALKKPKAKEPNKRDMTFEEKQRLSNNLQNLPTEKLDNVVHIIKKHNMSLSQHDNEIEVDIDSVGTETLWELDRFVTNYKKSLSKNKKKAELAIQSRQQKPDDNVQEMNQSSAVVEVPKENDKHTGSSSPFQEEKKGDDGRVSCSSGSSSSGSGSSSSDSESESSSA